ncbi:hypothetical protein [Actinomadura nitritigenes]|uniref:hypothetical protein n=1 Tax=Actinomadura nitritigenes TaxID=134602 RepID=UPI003D8EC7FD
MLNTPDRHTDPQPAPQPAPHPPAGARNGEAGDIRDPATGKVRVLGRRCTTCIFRPDDPMFLGEEYTQRIIDANLQADALLTCHQTLPGVAPAGYAPAACNGFFRRHARDVMSGRLALMLGVTEIAPPEKDTDPIPPERDCGA